MKTIVLITTLLMLAACGINGKPKQPSGGIQTSGEARIGVVGGL